MKKVHGVTLIFLLIDDSIVQIKCLYSFKKTEKIGLNPIKLHYMCGI